VSVQLTLAYWSLAVALAPHCGGSRLDSILCDKGSYTKGPFTTIKEVRFCLEVFCFWFVFIVIFNFDLCSFVDYLTIHAQLCTMFQCSQSLQLDPEYLDQLVNQNSISTLIPHIDKLKSYLSTGRLPSIRLRSAPHKADVVEFINISLALLALNLRLLSPDLSESAIDLLCVSGLIHYPPAEGGPLSYLARLGNPRAKARWGVLCKRMPADIVHGIVESVGAMIEPEASDNLFVKSLGTGLFKETRDNSLLMDKSELLEIGPTGVLRTREAFMYPLPFVVATGVTLFLIISALCVFVYFIL